MTDEELRKLALDYDRMTDGGTCRLMATPVNHAGQLARRLLELLPPADDADGPPFDAWSFVRDVLRRGTTIEQSAEAQGWNYERLSAALDHVARELADKLKPHLRAHQ